MIDIHHHLLYGLDDGSPDLTTSIEMAEAARADGITHIVCTPHASSSYRFQPEVNEERIGLLRQKLGDTVTLGLGCDFHLSYDNIADAIKNPAKYTINRRSYLLVEFPDFGIPHNMSETFYELQLAQMTPIITHPERNPTITSHPGRLAEWLRGGCLVQVTASSLTGRFGKTAERFANELLRKNWVHFLATDAHNLSSRPPYMREAYNYVVQHYGIETAGRLCVSNPRAAFDGEAWPDQPEPIGLYDHENHSDGQDEKKKGGFLSRLFSR